MYAGSGRLREHGTPGCMPGREPKASTHACDKKAVISHFNTESTFYKFVKQYTIYN